MMKTIPQLKAFRTIYNNWHPEITISQTDQNNNLFLDKAYWNLSDQPDGYEKSNWLRMYILDSSDQDENEITNIFD